MFFSPFAHLVLIGSVRKVPERRGSRTSLYLMDTISDQRYGMYSQLVSPPSDTLFLHSELGGAQGQQTPGDPTSSEPPFLGEFRGPIRITLPPRFTAWVSCNSELSTQLLIGKN